MKKLFAILMSIMMIACFMPTMAFAGGAGADITLSATHGSENANVDSLDTGFTFAPAKVGYKPGSAETLTVTVTKTDAVKGDITVVLESQTKTESGTAVASNEAVKEYFTLGKLAGNKLNFGATETKVAGDTATFTVTPKPDLGAGTYTATVKLTQAAGEATQGAEEGASTGKVTSFTVSFTVSKNTLTAGDFKFTAPNPSIYDGSAKTATVEAASGVTGIGNITIRYFKDNQSVVEAKDAGTYTVKIDVAVGTDYAAIENLTADPAWTFTIAKAEQAAPTEKLAGEAPTTQNGKGKITGTTEAMEYSTDQSFANPTGTPCGASETAVTPGNYYVRYKADNNHNPGTASNKITVLAYSAEKPPTETEIPASVMSAIKAYKGTYDGVGHDAITVGDAAKDYTVKYKVNGAEGDFEETVPQVTNVADCKEITVQVSKTGYTTATKPLTPSITKAKVTLEVEVADKVYDGTDKATVKEGTEPTLKGVVKQEAVTVDCSKMKFENAKAGVEKAINFDEVTLKGEANVLANYEFQKPADVKATISKAPLSITKFSIVDKIYDGKTTATVNVNTFAGLQNKETLEAGEEKDYTVTGEFNDANVDKAKSVTVTVTLISDKAKNYTIEPFNEEATIAKASATEEQKKATASAKSGEKGLADLSGKILEDGKVGTITIEANKANWFTETPKVEGGILYFTLAGNLKKDDTVKVTVPVEKATNYNDYNIEVIITVSDTSVLTVVAPKANTLTYNGKNQPLVTAGATSAGTMQYSLEESKGYTEAIPEAKDANESYTVYYKVVDGEQTVTGSNTTGQVPVTIAKKPVTVQPKSFTIKQDDKLPTLVLEYVGLIGKDELTVGKDYQPAFKYMQGDKDVTDPKEVGTYTIKWTNANAQKFTNSNYEVKVVDEATLTIEAKAPFSGGSYYPYTPSTPSKPAAPNLDKTKTDSTTAINAAATANKYDAAEQAEVKKILDKANADIKNAKTEAEVKAIEEAAQAEIDKILTTEEKAIVAALDNVEKRDFATKSKVITRKGGKKVIRLTWTAPDGVDVDGYEIFRSTKKNSGFGKKPYFTTSNTSYTNTKDLKAGKTYYYKVRAFVVINGERVYTDYSLKANRKL